MSIYDRHLCQTYWASHGCQLSRYHDGDHVCSDPELGECCRITRDGIDEHGRQQNLYGDDVPDDFPHQADPNVWWTPRKPAPKETRP